MANKQNPTEDKLFGIISLLSIGELKCDKCGKSIRHLERYCDNTQECPFDGNIFNTVEELNKHFSQQHPQVPARGTRYCVEDSLKAGYLKMVRNKKTEQVYPAMFVLRDEETD